MRAPLGRTRRALLLPAAFAVALAAGCGERDAAHDPVERTATDARRSAAEVAAVAESTTPPPEPPTGPPSLLLVTLDTVRADHVGAYGATPSPTPTLDALAEQGLLFENAIATNPETLPSHVSILTGLYPTEHGVRTNGRFALAQQRTLVSEVLSERGWRTGAFVASVVLESRFGLAQGFEVYDTAAKLGTGSLERRGDAVVRSAAAWLDSLAPDDRYFAWVHLYDPHYPYAAPHPWAAKFDDPYTAEIAYADAMVARLIAHLEKTGRARNLITVVTSDHGESLGEHGETSHATLIYQASMHVPLIVSGSGFTGPRGARVASPVTISQLAPSILAWVGLPADALPDSKLPKLYDADPPPAVYLESLYPFYSRGFASYRGVVEGRDKLILGPRRELFSLAEDPSERNDLAGSESARADRLEARLQELVARHAPITGTTSVQLSDAERSQLAELGYVVAQQASPETQDPFDPSLPDAALGFASMEFTDRGKARLSEAQRLLFPDPRKSEAQNRERRRQGRAELSSLREELERELAANPLDGVMRWQLGVCLNLLEDFEGAIPIFEARYAVMPFDPETSFQLAIAYAGVGRGDEARELTERAVESGGAQPHYLEWLVAHHREAGRHDEALYWAKRYANESSGDLQRRASRLLNELRSDRPEAAAQGDPSAR